MKIIMFALMLLSLNSVLAQKSVIMEIPNNCKFIYLNVPSHAKVFTTKTKSKRLQVHIKARFGNNVSSELGTYLREKSHRYELTKEIDSSMSRIFLDHSVINPMYVSGNEKIDEKITYYVHVPAGKELVIVPDRT